MKGNSYLHRKIHSLLGVIPLGGFIFAHLLTNYSAHQGGPEKFESHVAFIHSLPLVLALEIFLIWLPLLYHGVYGLYVAYQSRNNVSNYGYVRNWAFAAQRITGVITFVFVVWHVWDTRVQVALGHVDKDALGSHMHEIASNPLFYWIYIVGIIAAVFHFCNGLWSFLVSWGITVGPRAQRFASYATMGLFVIMSVMFIMSLNAFLDESFAATASALLTK
ncbi:succinate dehydrogenase cytochrome b558 subunit [Paenibacillus sp. TRM 82003]|nr:succinate dehydrogenase cytochrome b558 subunit [Paenibacillus sp. TRM 82003]